jgi:type IV pilus assembly protein PilV
LTPARQRRPRHQAGATLIEVLVAVLILSIGLLGIAGLQARALQNNQSAFERSQAVMLSYFMLDAMRANVDAARAGDYNMAKTCEAVGGGTLIANDQQAWIAALKQNMGDRDTTCGEIVCDEDACAVSVYWDDTRAISGNEEQVIVTTSRL